MTRPSIREVALNPDWIPHAFDATGQSLTSVLVPSAARTKLVFLTDGQFKDHFRKVTLPVESLAVEARPAIEAPLRFIFHTSFCCSTLLAKALGATGKASTLSEPNILVNLADQSLADPCATVRSRLDFALHLLARPLAPGETVVVKQSSFANRLIEPVLKIRPESRGLLLYSDPQTFLASVVRRGLLGRINARKLYRALAAPAALDFGFSQVETFEQTDLQIAALAWLMQIAHFNDLAGRLGPDRLMVLDAADLLADPVTKLRLVLSFFGLDVPSDQLRSIVEGKLFSTHSKFSDRPYDAKSRETDRDLAIKAHSAEVSMVVDWMHAVAQHLGVPLRPQSGG